MKLAILADIHGNLPALRAVMDDMAGRGVTGVVNLGDCASGPLFAAGTVALLVAEGWPTVRGNHDRVVGCDPLDGMYISDRQAHEELDAGARAWLAGLPVDLDLGSGIHAFHARPDNDAKYLLEAVEDGRLVAAPPEKVARRLGDAPGRVILTGHSHRAAVLCLDDGRVVINPGSVGQPAFEDDRPPVHRSEAGSPFARYAILDMDGERIAGLAFHAVPYDHEAAARRAEAKGRPDWAVPLRTGRMP